MQFGNVLITGGAGFIGSQLVKKLEPLSEQIYVIDNLSVGKRNAIPDSKKIHFFHASITDEKLLADILPSVEWIFHLSCSSLTVSMTNIQEDYCTNFYAGYLLLTKAKELCSNLKRIVYTSTASIYGNPVNRPTSEDYFQITTPYSASKFCLEHYCSLFYRMFSVPISIVRLSNVYGPGQLASNPYCGVVAKFFEALLEGKPFTIFGDGKQTRDFTYVEDALEAILSVSQSSVALGKTYNVGTGIETSVNQLAQKVCEAWGYTSYPVNYCTNRTIDHIKHRSVDISSIKQDLSWFPRHTLSEGLGKTYQWFIQKDSPMNKGDCP